MPSRSVDLTPVEKWFDRKPSLKNLRVFGSPAYVHVPDVKRSKFDHKARKLLFVGYCDDRKAFRFLNPENDEITISRDARFIELGDGSLNQRDPVSDGSEQFVELDVDSGEEPTAEEDSAELESQEDEATLQEESCSDYYDPDEEEGAVGGELPVPKRSTRGVLPKRFEDYEVDAAIAVEGEPDTYEEAVNSSELDLWKAAMAEEYDALMRNDTWSLVQLPSGRVPIGCKWIYKKKEDSSGNVSRFKARLVAQGFSQRYGVDYDAVFAPVASQATLRILLTVAGYKKMAVRHLDVKSAYLHGKLQDEIYMQQPKGFVVPGKEKFVCRLKRSLYGLKQAARIWNTTISELLKGLGFDQSRSDPCLFIKRSPGGGFVYLMLHVDDMIVAGMTEKEIDAVEFELRKKITLSSLGEIGHFLGIRITKDKNGFYCLDQENYIKKVASRFGLEHAKGSSVPIDVGYFRSREGSKELPDNERYRSLAGALLYVAVNTRPDVAASVSLLCRRISQPTEVDWNELKRVVKYLMKTSNSKLRLCAERGKPLRLSGYCDADWGGDTADRKSNTGYLFLLGEASVSWASRKQSSVSLSSMEAEYIAVSEACKELVWLRRMLDEMGAEQCGPTVLFEDNRSCMEFVEMERVSRRSKHIDTRMFYTKDMCEKGLVELRFCPSENMTADLLTKPLGPVKQKKFAEAMGLTEVESWAGRREKY